MYSMYAVLSNQTVWRLKYLKILQNKYCESCNLIGIDLIWLKSITNECNL